MRLTPTMAQILNLLHGADGQPIIVSDERYKVAADALREAGYVSIVARMVPRFPDNGRNIWSLEQQQLQVTAYYVRFTEAGQYTYGDGNV